MTLWVVRASKYGEHESDVRGRGVVAIGYSEIGDLTQSIDLDEMQSWEAKYRRIAPDANERSIGARTGALWTFARKIKIGDKVVLPLKSQSAIALACVQSEYEYRPDFPEGMRHTRRVQMERERPPPQRVRPGHPGYSFGSFADRLSGKIRNERRSTCARAQFDGTPPPAPSATDVPAADEPDAAAAGRDGRGTSPRSSSRSRLRDLVVESIARDFKGHDLADLTGAIVKAQGYEVEVSPPGPDGGVDVLAGRGGLGLRGAPHLRAGQIRRHRPTDVNVLRGLAGSHETRSAPTTDCWSPGVDSPSPLSEERHGSTHFKIRLWDQGDLVRRALRRVRQVARSDPGEAAARAHLGARPVG